MLPAASAQNVRAEVCQPSVRGEAIRPRRKYSADAIAIWNSLGAHLGMKGACTDKNGVVWAVWLACKEGVDEFLMHELGQLLDKQQMDKLLEMMRYRPPELLKNGL